MGSVQAETVRLQRQYDPGLIGIHLKLAEFLSQEQISKLKIQQSLDTINLEIKKSEKKNFGQKIVCEEHNLVVHLFLFKQI